MVGLLLTIDCELVNTMLCIAPACGFHLPGAECVGNGKLD